MAKKDLFDSIDVPAPCPKSWDAMRGDEKARFCASCEKDVHNLSELTRKEAKKLLFQSNKSVCVRIEKNADGRIKTLKRQFHQITRQVPLAASVLSASLTFSAVVAAQKNNQPPRIGKPAVPQSVKDAKSAASISGVVGDGNGAIVPNVQIILRGTKNKAVRKTISNNDGFYEFKNVASSVYEIKVEASGGFRAFVQKNIKITDDKDLQLPIILKPDESEVTVGMLAETPQQIIEPTDTKIRDAIQTRQINALPVSGRNVAENSGFREFVQKNIEITDDKSLQLPIILKANSQVKEKARKKTSKRVSKKANKKIDKRRVIIGILQ